MGSRYSMRMHVGSADVGGLVEVVEFDEPGDLAWTSVTGIDQRGRWRLRENDDGGTRVTLRLQYGAPGGLLAAVSDRLSAPIVSGHLERSLENLKRELEGDAGVSDDLKRGPLESVTYNLGSLGVMIQSGIVKPIRPDRLFGVAMTLARWGRSPAAGYLSGVARYPDRDQHHRRARVADLQGRQRAHQPPGLGAGRPRRRRGRRRGHHGPQPPLLHRGHGGVSKLGADSLYMNTAFSAPQLAEVADREKPKAIIYDEEFAELIEDAGKRRKRFVAWTDSEDTDDPTLEELMAEGDPADPVPPEREGRAVILTSGTTGTPKGASRGNAESLDPAVSFLSKIPLKAEQTTHIAAPLFHSWGFAHFTLGLFLGSTYVLRRKFDPEASLAEVDKHNCYSLAVVPVMMKRILELPEETRRKYDLSSLKVVAASGSALPGDMAIRWMDEFGDTLYNLYGSTEVAWASIATPADMRAAPGTAGKPPRGTVVKLFDEEEREVPDRGDRAHLRRQRDAVRGLHRRRLEGRDRRPDGHRRRRALRRERPPVRRGPRRRDDRLGRRERVPQGGRGPDLAPRRAWPTWPRSAWRTTSSASASALSWWPRAPRSPPRRTSRATSRRTSPATRCRARSCSWTSCRATPPARSSSASWPRWR